MFKRRNRSILRICVLCGLALALSATESLGEDPAEKMARQLQDPLANIKAVLTDNDFLFKSGDEDETGFSSNIQPLKGFAFEDLGFNLMVRGVIPVLGMPGGAQKPILGEPVPSGEDRVWGLSDIQLQTFFSPRSDSSWKWGVGPMISLRTRTNSDLAGAGWGAGPIGVIVGSLSENVSTAILGGHLWGNEDGFSTTILQPMFFYNIPWAKGWEIQYNNTITYDWNAESGNRWTIPLGLGVGKTLAFESGWGLNAVLGYYHNAEKPEGAADGMLRLSLNFILP